MLPIPFSHPNNMNLIGEMQQLEERAKTLRAFVDKYAHILPGGTMLHISEEPTVCFLKPPRDIVGAAFGTEGWQRISDGDVDKFIDGVRVILWDFEQKEAA